MPDDGTPVRRRSGHSSVVAEPFTRAPKGYATGEGRKPCDDRHKAGGVPAGPVILDGLLVLLHEERWPLAGRCGLGDLLSIGPDQALAVAVTAPAIAGRSAAPTLAHAATGASTGDALVPAPERMRFEQTGTDGRVRPYQVIVTANQALSRK